MLGFSVMPLAAFVGVVFGCVAFFKSIVNVAAAMHLLVIVLIFGGIVAVNIGAGGLAVPFRDIFIVLPLYLCIFTTREGQRAATLIPVDVTLAIVFFVLVTMVCVLNPEGGSAAQTLIGLKVWLFYIPFVVVGITVAHQPKVTVGLFRQILFWGSIACGVGLLQSLLVRLWGYDVAIRIFFGQYASRVTQGFAYFDRGGGIYRIPGTFSFVTQYAGFLYLFLTVAIIVANVDPDPRIRRFGTVAVFAAVLAGVLSGSRAAILVFPALLLLYGLFGVLPLRLLLFAPVGVAIWAGGLALAGTNPVDYFLFGQELAVHYTQDFIFQQISYALDLGPMGSGLGASTAAARYAIGGAAIDDGPLLFFESYFAKAAAEMGYLGLAAILIVFAVVAWRGILTIVANLYSREGAIIAPAVVYLGYNLVMSAKGFVLDVDPGNIFFWLLLGVVVGLDRGRRVEPVASEASRAAPGEAEAYKVP